jgi:hypothetical protein
MAPELVALTILAIAAIAVGLLMLADRAGWQSPLPRLHLDQRWIGLFWVLLVVATALQALRLSGVL